MTYPALIADVSGCESIAAWLVAALAGGCIAAVASRAVLPLMAPLPGDRTRSRALILVGIAAAAWLWWWEVRLDAILPPGMPKPACSTEALRFAGHMILAGFLAAATWIDLRHRVIPDAITVPGVLTGLAWNTVFPDTLPPVAREIARTFAPPVLEADVLGPAGGLASVGLPSWLGPVPSVIGLAAAAGVFAAWWWVGMPPDAVTDERDASPSRTAIAIRWLIAAGGLTGIGLAWFVGRSHWQGLVTALAGLAGAAGMIWATRAGASRALGREAMGFGDVTLMAMVGSWIGWQPCVLVCMIGVFIGLGHGVGQLLRHAESELPFGPSLCLATVVVLAAWRPLWAAAGPQFARPLELASVVAAVIGLTAVTLWAWQRLRRGGID